MPCLNEARTVGSCVAKARASLDKMGVYGEVIVADNGSTDGSQDLARQAGARVINVTRKGYGSALQGGIAAALNNLALVLLDRGDLARAGELYRQAFEIARNTGNIRRSPFVVINIF